MFKLVVNYPSSEDEARILAMHSMQVDLDQRLGELQTVTQPQEIVEIARRNSNVLIDPKLLNYINALVRLTRQWPQFHMGASPRAGLALMQGAGPWPRSMGGTTPCPTTSWNWPCRPCGIA